MLPLIPAAVTLLDELRGMCPTSSPWVFWSPTSASGHWLAESREAWTRIRRHAGLEHIRQRDLRRTVASLGVSLGASMAVVGATLGHKPRSQVTNVYARMRQDPIRELLEKVAESFKPELDV